MKNTKTPTPKFAQPDDIIDAIKDRIAPSQRGALETLFMGLHATGEEDELTAMPKALSTGLFVLGLDRAGSFCLTELTEVLHGERSGEVYSQIADAGNTATDARVDVEYDERRRIYGKAAEVNA
jgi:hypothetical protein